MERYISRLADLPPRINAVVVLDSEGDYNIYINARLDEEARQRAYNHEIRHIKKAHFYADKSAAECEKEAKECEL